MTDYGTPSAWHVPMQFCGFMDKWPHVVLFTVSYYHISHIILLFWPHPSGSGMVIKAQVAMNRLNRWDPSCWKGGLKGDCPRRQISVKDEKQDGSFALTTQKQETRTSQQGTMVSDFREEEVIGITCFQNCWSWEIFTKPGVFFPFVESTEIWSKALLGCFLTLQAETSIPQTSLHVSFLQPHIHYQV